MLTSRRKRIAVFGQSATDVGHWQFSNYQLVVDSSAIPTAVSIHPLSPLNAEPTAEQPSIIQNHVAPPLVPSDHDTITDPQAAQVHPISLLPLHSHFSPPPLHQSITAATYPPSHPLLKDATAGPSPEIVNTPIFTVGSVASDRTPVPWPLQMKNLETPINEDWPATPASEEELLMFRMDEWNL
ncbi:hypothetical protein BX666DRAFT_2032564 [Dichotomocladium elegans]|nr:hypothetical protein BX666DRAFT_2032564 [Dichotomocladium elegans]